MKTTYFRLTKSENEIMELLWREGRPLLRDRRHLLAHGRRI